MIRQSGDITAKQYWNIIESHPREGCGITVLLFIIECNEIMLIYMNPSLGFAATILFGVCYFLLLLRLAGW
uniref:Uncharacterized protein n=1 Tax=Physcomitrium patens TaxID=3218 RepID=A0A2K1IIB9_PHYPA|nr:hypothetical protein PHYPA_027712 [Physcomitrium patens]